MHFISRLLGLGLVAGAAFAAVKLVQKVWPREEERDGTYTTQLGGAPEEPAVQPLQEQPSAVPAPRMALPDQPNPNPVEAPPAIPVTDPLKIADPADFADWDDLGCRG